MVKPNQQNSNDKRAILVLVCRKAVIPALTSTLAK